MTTEPTNDNKATTPEFNTAAEVDINNRFFADVQKYKEADPQVKTALDQRMATLNFKDLNTITTYAKVPSEAFGKSSDDVIRKVQAVDSLLSPFGSIKDQLARIDLETVGKLVERYGQKMARLAQKGALSVMKHPWAWGSAAVASLFTGLLIPAIALAGFLGAKNFAKQHREPTMDDIKEQVNENLLKVGEVVANMEEARDKIPAMVEALNMLRNNRLALYSDYGLEIGAAAEQYRRWKEETLPRMELENKDLKSPLKQAEIDQLKFSITALNIKLTAMTALHQDSLRQLATIKSLQEALVQGQLKIDGHLTIGQHMWKGMLAEGLAAAQVATIVQSGIEGDKFGDKLLGDNVKLSGMITKMMEASYAHGTIDPAKVIQALRDTAKGMEDHAAFMDKLNKDQEQVRAELVKAGQDLRDRAAKLGAPIVVGQDQKQIAPPAVEVKPGVEQAPERKLELGK